MTAWDQFGPDYDFPEYPGQPMSYLIATTPRCGSHHLGHLLTATGMLGSPLEYFSKGRLRDWREKLAAADTVDLFRQLFRRRTSPSGWFGVKAHWPQFQQIMADEEVCGLFNFRRYLHIERRDRLVGEHELGLVHERASNGHPLLLTTREGVGALERPVAETNAFQLGEGFLSKVLGIRESTHSGASQPAERTGEHIL